MTDKQPEALRIAEWFEGGYGGWEYEAAAELRRLHEENKSLRAVIDDFTKVLAMRMK